MKPLVLNITLTDMVNLLCVQDKRKMSKPHSVKDFNHLLSKVYHSIIYTHTKRAERQRPIIKCD